MLRIDWVDVDAHIRDKIEVKHGISFEEVLEACSQEADEYAGPGRERTSCMASPMPVVPAL